MGSRFAYAVTKLLRLNHSYKNQYDCCICSHSFAETLSDLTAGNDQGLLQEGQSVLLHFIGIYEDILIKVYIFKNLGESNLKCIRDERVHLL